MHLSNVSLCVPKRSINLPVRIIYHYVTDKLISLVRCHAYHPYSRFRKLPRNLSRTEINSASRTKRVQTNSFTRIEYSALVSMNYWLTPSDATSSKCIVTFFAGEVEYQGYTKQRLGETMGNHQGFQGVDSRKLDGPSIGPAESTILAFFSISFSFSSFFFSSLSSRFLAQ